MMKALWLPLLVALGAVTLSAAPANARDAWRDVLKACANDDLLGKDVLYLGPTSTTGPGSVLRKRKPKGFGIRWLSGDMKLPSAAISLGKTATCTGTANPTVELSGGVNLENAVAPMSGDLSVNFKKGRSVVLAVSGYQWDAVVEGPYEAWVDKAAPEEIKNDLQKARTEERRQVLLRGLAVTGFSAEITYEPKIGAEVKGKLPDGALPNSKLGFNAIAKWQNTTKLTITSSGPVYVAGDLSNYGPEGFSGSESSGSKKQSFKIRKPKLSNLEQETAAREPVR